MKKSLIEYNPIIDNKGWVNGNIMADYNVMNNHFGMSNNASIIPEPRQSVGLKNNEKDKKNKSKLVKKIK